MTTALGSVRFRITLAATLVVGIVLGVGGVVLIRLQSDALSRSVDTALRLRADDIESLLLQGSILNPVAVTDNEVAAVQVVDANGTVVAASANLAGQPRLSAAQPRRDADMLFDVKTLPFEPEPFRMLARQADASGGPVTIYVAATADDAAESAAILRTLLLIGIPLVTVFAGAGVWLLVGRAFAPVEGIRREVAQISDTDFSRRVPEPRTQDEVGRLARTMNGMLARVEHAYELQKSFVADAAHELRSPLASIRTQLEVDNIVDGDLHAEVLRMQRLVDDLLLLASSGAARQPVSEMRLIDLEDVVDAESERVRKQSPVPIDVTRVAPVAVRGDPELIGRALGNLLQNAVRFARSEVSVELSEGPDGVTLAVTDDGPGIRAEDRERIFDRFARVDSGRARDNGGTGLGLAIVKAVSQQLGGRVWVEPGATRGSRFVIQLPSADGPTSTSSHGG